MQGKLKPSLQRRTRALALVEILASILTISIVSAIFWPVFASGHPTSTRSYCLSNLKQVGIGMLMYTADFDDRLPKANQWMDLSFPYVKRDDLYHCPGLKKIHQDGYGYAMRSRLGGVSVEMLKKPENEPMAFDSLLLEKNANTNMYELVDSDRHPYQNIEYADGHAKPMHPSNSQ